MITSLPVSATSQTINTRESLANISRFRGTKEILIPYSAIKPLQAM
jgi:hypothetical protein